MAFGVQAQYIYNDFDENQNETFLGDPNIPSVIANPHVEGINTSAGVAEWVRATNDQYTHVYTIVDGTIDFSTGTTFQLKVYSPIACEVLFKLESSAYPSISTEVMGNVTTPNEWQQLSYDFTGAASGAYDKIVIFFDFATMVENTFYFDDVTGPDYVGGNPVTLPVTFEDEDVIYGLTDFGGNISEIVVDPTNAENHVAKTIKTEGAETWAGTTVGGIVGFPNPIPFAPEATTMTVNVWSPTAGTRIRLKVEASNDETVTCETEAVTTVAMEWEELTFDFSNEAPGTAELNFASSYNKASIFFDFDANGTGETYYWDNMIFGISTRISENIIEETTVYPNPVSDILYLENAINLNNVSIYSVVGQLVFQSEKVNNSINVSEFPAGLYTLLANSNDGKQYFAKFIVK